MGDRNLLQYIIITLKGMAMGAADVVPGVSGGTIAFISGIYEELITSINNINFSLIKIWRKEGFKAFWSTLNGNFLLALFLGIGISVLSLAKFIIEPRMCHGINESCQQRSIIGNDIAVMQCN